MKKLLGYVLIGLGLLGVFYFKGYRGDVIPVPMLWLVVSLGVVVLGTYLLMIARTQKEVRGLDNLKAQINRIKESGERIQIDFENCDFKTTNVHDQIKADDFSRIQIFDALYGSNRNNSERASTVTYIIYKYQNGDKAEKFVSQPFPVEETMLRYYVSNNNIVLYVDRNDRKQYFFDVQR
ncbi:hypothetical protein [Flavisolibacter nicotianae]|uniref:hypothetical protein n=1 Tax=Flavisolibacter nicotianae TaxID=2364882 RepID=UPI0013C49F82|nr:hypothetical protein [Flavisolibacter nicotianae]